MPNYRRAFVPGGCWFFTVNLFERLVAELSPLLDGSDLTAAEVRVHLAFGAVVRLDDLLLRRVRIGLWRPAVAREIVPHLRVLFEQELGWDHHRWDQEVEAFGRALQGWSVEGTR